MSSRARFVASAMFVSAVVAGVFAASATRAPEPPPKRPVPLRATPQPATPQPATPKPAPPRTPALLVRLSDEAPQTPLAVERASYAVSIDGLTARTRATLVFRNGLDRVLDGELVFPLPENALITGFALDVNGRLVDGVVVEAQEARVAFESETRRRVDPGLVEWVTGNNFRTRVFPIPARGHRTIALEYLTDLAVLTRQTRQQAIYELPLRFSAPISELSVKVDVARGDTPPAIESGLEGATFSPWRSRWVTDVTRRDVTPGDDLRLVMPDVPADAVIVDRTDRGETFFAVDATAPATTATTLPAPSTIAVAWDASFSRADADRERELRLLAAHLKRLGRVDVEVIVFRNVAEPARRFHITNGDATMLIEFLRSEPNDGATNLGALTLPTNVSYTLLFSDGLSTLGTGRGNRAAQPVYAVSGDPRADHARLRALAEESGGAYVNLQRHTDAEAADRLGRPALALLGVDVDSTAVGDVEPAAVQAISGGRARVTGRLLAADARLTLRFGVPGSDRRTHQTRTVVVRRADERHSPDATDRESIAAHLWAQQRMAALARDPDANRAALVQLGQRFSIVTPGTSLLVLETLDQYVRHNVTPPASWPEMRTAFLDMKQRDATIERAKLAGKTDRVLEMWNRRVEWWSRSFPERSAQNKIEGDASGAMREPLPTSRQAADLQSVGQRAAAPAVSVPQSADRASFRAATGPPPAPEAAAKFREDTTDAGDSGGRIVVQPWNPDTPYLRSLQTAPDDQLYRRYLAERGAYGSAPSFYLDCANVFAERGQLALALRVLTTVAELRLEDARLMRVLAHRLSQVGELDLAIDLFERVRALRPEEPQSWRDLALVLDTRSSARGAAQGAASAASIADARRAVSLLAEIVEREWDGRFPEVEVLALVEANRIAARIERAGAEARWPLDPRLHHALDFDVRVVLTWDTDDSDMDLWVVEPSGEKAYYGHPQTMSGGLLSRDFTGGYGPEEYSLRRAAGGDYHVKANFFGSRAQSLVGPTTVQATIITDYGRPTEARRSVTLRLTSARDVVDIGAVEIAKKRPTSE